MMRPIIKAEGLSKRYEIGAGVPHYATLRDVFAETFKRPLGRLFNGRKPTPEIWALRDVSFSVLPGEVLGIVGRNGAGKSTLLKILSQITEPTTGRVELYGRVGSLLEVGTGFHPELTGRENVFLNGAILGMKRREISRRFDEIVAFAEIEQFLDTPVKHYSSGMFVRLAFAVAAHLEPDILLVDEVLAVGDGAFRAKCIGKMGDVARQGRTVVFISHHMSAVKSLCTSAMLMRKGQIVQVGPTPEVVVSYLAELELVHEGETTFPVLNPEYDLGIQYCRVELVEDESGVPEALRVSVGIVSGSDRRRVGIGLGLTTELGVRVATLEPKMTGAVFEVPAGVSHFVVESAGVARTLSAGQYVVGVWLWMPPYERVVYVDRAAVVVLPGSDLFGTGYLSHANRHGPVLLPLRAQRVESADPTPRPASGSSLTGRSRGQKS